MNPRSYKPWAVRMTCCADKRNLRPPSCCKVLVMNGGLGDERYGLSSTERTLMVAFANRSTSDIATASVSTTTPSLALPKLSKSFPVATRLPSTSSNAALNEGLVADTMSRPQYPAVTKAMRSRSRSTIKRTVGLCTRPADNPRFTLRHNTGDTS